MNNKAKRHRRHLRVRKKVKGTQSMPRLVVFRSNKNIYAQIVDDNLAKTIAFATSLKLKNAKDAASDKNQKIKQAQIVGESLASAALKHKVKKVVFDRAGYKYHGRIKALADSARKGGLEF